MIVPEHAELFCASPGLGRWYNRGYASCQKNNTVANRLNIVDKSEKYTKARHIQRDDTSRARGKLPSKPFTRIYINDIYELDANRCSLCRRRSPSPHYCHPSLRDRRRRCRSASRRQACPPRRCRRQSPPACTHCCRSVCRFHQSPSSSTACRSPPPWRGWSCRRWLHTSQRARNWPACGKGKIALKARWRYCSAGRRVP